MSGLTSFALGSRSKRPGVVAFFWRQTRSVSFIVAAVSLVVPRARG